MTKAKLKIKKSTIWIGLIVLVVAALVILWIAGVFSSLPSPTNVNYVDSVSSLADYSTPEIYALGNKSAPVTITEWSDFECPFCARFYEQTEGQIIDKYVRTGEARFIFKQFPLTTIHPYAYSSAMASECAGAQGKFWQFHELVYQNQATLDTSILPTWAEKIGLNMVAYNACMKSNEFTSKINSDLQAGVNAGVTGTPAFTINGQFIEGAQPFSVFDAAIQQALANTTTSNG